MGAGCFEMCRPDPEEHELREHGLSELRARGLAPGSTVARATLRWQKSCARPYRKKGATGSRHLACRCLNSVRRPRANSGNLHDQSLASFNGGQRRATAPNLRLRCRASTLSGSAPSSIRKLVFPASFRRPIQNQDQSQRRASQAPQWRNARRATARWRRFLCT
jgi:hypothetical protein